MEPEVSDQEAKHYAEIGLTAEGCRKVFVPDQIKADEDSRRVSFTISTGAVDRDNDTIKVDGWDVRNYMKNPVVLWAHRSDQLPVAKAVSVVKTSGALKATAEFPPAGLHPLSDTVFEFLKRGYLGSTSVGFRPKRDKNGAPRLSWNEERGGFDFEEQELLEFSVVPVPSNPEALMAMAKDFAGGKAAGVDLEPIRKALALSEIAAEPAAPPAEPVEKSGRRLSSKTEASLRSAHKSASEAVEHLSAVLDKAEEQMDEDEPKSTPAEPRLYVTPAKSEPVFQVNPEAVQAAVAAAITETVRSEVNRLRGRLD